MKKLILFAAILFAGVSVVKAQNESTVVPVIVGHEEFAGETSALTKNKMKNLITNV